MADEKKGDDSSYVLKQDKFPHDAKGVTAFIATNDEQCDESIVSYDGKDRRQKYDELWMEIQNVARNKLTVDISKYIVQLTMQFGEGNKKKLYVGTGTIIRIVYNKLFLLTCGHNVVRFHAFKNETKKAKNIWFSFDNKIVNATKFHVLASYSKEKKLGNDLAVIECQLNSPFMFYHMFPGLKYLRPNIVSRFRNFFSQDVAHKKKTDQENLHDGEIYGYPGEKNGEFWGMTGQIEVISNKNLISYNEIDTTGGQSGSPIFVNGKIVGVHTNGDHLGVKENYGTMLTYERITWINNLIPCQVGQCHPSWYKKNWKPKENNK